jgi:hypothetical protein
MQVIKMMMRHTFVAALMMSCTALVCAQQPAKVEIVEVKHNAPAVGAPRECLSAFRSFFQYLQTSDPGIVRDEPAQKRWLTQELRKALAQKVGTFTSPADDPDYPGNNTFIGSWDRPSSYSIVSSRRYGNRAVIDVLYKWGPKTNYPGDERTTSFIFVLEDGAWKLDDIYTFRGKFAQAESLSQYLLEK